MKNEKKFLCIILTVTALLLCACSSTITREGEETDEAYTEASVNDAAGKQAEFYDETASGGETETLYKFDTVEEYIQSDVLQESISGLKDAYINSGIDLSVTGKDNQLIYTFRYIDLTKSDELTEALKSGLEANADSFTDVASSLKLAVNEENPEVIVRYVDSNGDEICSQTFKTE